MSEEKKEKSEEDYRAMIRDRAKKSAGLRQFISEAKIEPEKSLKQVVELRKEEKKKSKD